MGLSMPGCGSKGGRHATSALEGVPLPSWRASSLLVRALPVVDILSKHCCTFFRYSDQGLLSDKTRRCSSRLNRVRLVVRPTHFCALLRRCYALEAALKLKAFLLELD